MWKDIKNYEGLYKVNENGEIKSLERDVIYKNGRLHHYEEKILKTRVAKSGYIDVALHKDGKITYFLVHRLVAEAFIPNPNDYPQINHKDEDKRNNNVSNLEWCTADYNINYGTRNERTRITNITNGKLSRKVKQILNGVVIKVWKSTRQIERELGLNHTYISQCCNHSYLGGKTHYKGYEWSY